MNCQHCGAITTNGLALCELCQRKGTDCLESLPVYFRNLARQRRPGRPNGSVSSGGGGSDDGIPVTTLVGRASNDVDTWARVLAEDRGIELPECETEVETFAATCQLLSDNIASVANLEWGGEFLRDITKHEKVLRTATATLIPGWYAGACRRCGEDTYVIPGLTWVTCAYCGVTTFARDHLETVLIEAQDWVARPKALSAAIVAMVDTEQSVERMVEKIKKWDQRDKLTALRRIDEDGDEVGFKRYRMGDVLGLVFSGTRMGDVLGKAS